MERSSIYDYNFYGNGNKRYRTFLTGFYTLQPIVERLGIESIVDFGCGSGGWLYAAKKLSVKSVLGIDGNYVNRSLLMIDESEFMPFDLEKRIVLDQRYDLAISIEVAEHLHESASDLFIDSICSSANIVFFTAAQPGKNGPNLDINHFNEQPIMYWAEKFRARGYIQIDVRPYYINLDKRISKNSNKHISLWVRQNASMYVKEEIYEDIVKRLGDVVLSR